MAIKRPSPSFLIFRDKQGNWRWNFTGPGGRVLAISKQAFTRPAGCMRAIKMLKGSSQIPVVGVEKDLDAVRGANAKVPRAAGKAQPAAKPAEKNETAKPVSEKSKAGTKGAKTA